MKFLPKKIFQKTSPSKSTVTVLNERLTEEKDAGKRVRVLNEALDGKIDAHFGQTPNISQTLPAVQTLGHSSAPSGAIYYTLNQSTSGQRVMRSDSGRYSERAQIRKVHAPGVLKSQPVVRSNTGGFEIYRI